METESLLEIYPRDMGTENYLTLVRSRLSPMTSAAHYRAPGLVVASAAPHEARPLRNRRLRRYWTRGLNLNEEEAEKVGSIAWNSAPGTGARVGSAIFSLYLVIFGIITLSSGAVPAAMALFIGWLALIFGMMATPRQALRRAHQRPLDSMEIETLIPTARGRLETAYVNLVRDVLQTEVPSPAAADEIRAALRAMGETISQLPAEPVRPQDAAALTQSMMALRTQASAETDSVIRDSLLRQAVTLEKQIGSANDAAKSARRVQTLRREVRVQMDALRSALLSFNDGAVTTHQTGAVTTALSDAMQHIAQEAQAVSLARQELADQEIAGLLGASHTQIAPATQTNAAPIAKPLLTPQPPVQEALPQQQVGQGKTTGQWWRNG